MEGGKGKSKGGNDKKNINTNSSREPDWSSAGD